MYWILWYTDLISSDVVREEKTNKMALFTKKEVAEEEAENLRTPFRLVNVVSQELMNVDKNYYTIVDNV